MKKILTIALVLVALASSLFAQGAQETSSSPTKIKVAATPDPHAALLNLIVEDLAAQGIELEVIEFTDYVVPNNVVEDGSVDADFSDVQ